MGVGPEALYSVGSESLKVGPISSLSGVSSIIMACAEILPKPGLSRFSHQANFIVLPSAVFSVWANHQLENSGTMGNQDYRAKLLELSCSSLPHFVFHAPSSGKKIPAISPLVTSFLWQVFINPIVAGDFPQSSNWRVRIRIDEESREK